MKNCQIWLVIQLIGAFVFISSCSTVAGRIPDKAESEGIAADSGKLSAATHLKILSKGMEKQEIGKKYLVIRFIQYSIDGNLLGAHDVTKDYERTVDLAPGKHFLHVERLRRGILSARALILDEGDCYAFSLSDEQTGVFEGAALPGLKWETKGFSGVASWEKMDNSSACKE